MGVSVALGVLVAGGHQVGAIGEVYIAKYADDRAHLAVSDFHIKSGTHRRVISQNMVIRYRTDPFLSLTTSHSKFTPIGSTQHA